MRFNVRLLMLITALGASGCSDWTGSRPAAAYLPPAGQYAPPAQSTQRVRVAVPDVAIENPAGLAPDVDAQAAASDELFAMLDASGRFDLTERMRLQQVLAEQGLADMFQPGRLVHPAPVHGFDYVMLGQLSGLAVRREPEPSNVSVAGVEHALNIGPGWSPKLIVDAKVDLMLVDVHSGAVVVSGKGEFHHTAPPKEFGLQLTSEQLLNTPQVRLTPADTHHVLKLVLDETLRPLLPRVDRWAAALPPPHDSLAGSPVANPLATQPSSRPVPQVLTATQICPECGARVAADQEFCPNCGHKLR